MKPIRSFPPCNARTTLLAGCVIILFGTGSAGLAEASDDQTRLAQGGGQTYCVTCYGETSDMTSKRTCYEISVPSQINMRLFGVRQCTALSGNFWYQFANGSCKGKRYCAKVIKR